MKNELDQQLDMAELEYWKERCLLAEKFIKDTIGDPETHPAYLDSYVVWQEFVNQPTGL